MKDISLKNNSAYILPDRILFSFINILSKLEACFITIIVTNAAGMSIKPVMM